MEGEGKKREIMPGENFLNFPASNGLPLLSFVISIIRRLIGEKGKFKGNRGGVALVFEKKALDLNSDNKNRKFLTWVFGRVYFRSRNFNRIRHFIY